MTIEEKNVLIAQSMNLSPMETGAYYLPQFGYVNVNNLWKDSFKPDQLKFHEDWNWFMFALKYFVDKYNLVMITIDASEPLPQVYEKLINLITTLNNLGYDN